MFCSYQFLFIVRGVLVLCPIQKCISQRKKHIFFKISGLARGKTPSDKIIMRQNEASFAEILEQKIQEAGFQKSSATRTELQNFETGISSTSFIQDVDTLHVFAFKAGQFQFATHGKYKTQNPAKSKKQFEKQTSTLDKTMRTPPPPPPPQGPSLKAALLEGEFFDAYQYLSHFFPLKTEFYEVELRKCFRKIALIYHPDKNPEGTRVFVEARKHYHLLLGKFESLEGVAI